MPYGLQDLGGGTYRVLGVRIDPRTGRYLTRRERLLRRLWQRRSILSSRRAPADSSNVPTTNHERTPQ